MKTPSRKAFEGVLELYKGRRDYQLTDTWLSHPMHTLIAYATLAFGSFLFLAQLVSSISFELAQRLGIQEAPDETDALPQRSERYTAFWDLVSLGWTPLAGYLMLIEHEWWPLMALAGGAIYLDTAGREAVKYMAMQHEGVRLGTLTQQRMFFASYIVMAVLGLALVLTAVAEMVR